MLGFGFEVSRVITSYILLLFGIFLLIALFKTVLPNYSLVSRLKNVKEKYTGCVKTNAYLLLPSFTGTREGKEIKISYYHSLGSFFVPIYFSGRVHCSLEYSIKTPFLFKSHQIDYGNVIISDFVRALEVKKRLQFILGCFERIEFLDNRVRLEKNILGYTFGDASFYDIETHIQAIEYLVKVGFSLLPVKDT